MPRAPRAWYQTRGSRFHFHHMGLVAGPTKDGMIHTIEGNTTASDNTNNYGGEVAGHQRPVSEVTVVGRLRY